MNLALPPGVEAYDRVEGAQRVWSNIVVSAYGATKRGKTHFGVRADSPRYVCWADPNDTLDYHLLKAEADGYSTDDTFVQRIPPIALRDLTRENAQANVDAIEQFAKWAVQDSARRVAAGEPGGTFILDGATMFKGYLEKAMLGESQTLGWRAEKGQRGGPSRFDAKLPNYRIRDFFAMFGQTGLDALLIWEGRQHWEGDNPTDRYNSTMPGAADFAVNAIVELVLVKKDRTGTVNGVTKVIGTEVEHRVRIGYNSFDSGLNDVTLPLPDGFKGLKELLLADVPVPEEMREPMGAPAADESMFEGGAGDDDD